MEETFENNGKLERGKHVITPAKISWRDVAISIYMEGFYKKPMLYCNDIDMLTCRAEVDEP